MKVRTIIIDKDGYICLYKKYRNSEISKYRLKEIDSHFRIYKRESIKEGKYGWGFNIEEATKILDEQNIPYKIGETEFVGI